MEKLNKKNKTSRKELNDEEYWDSMDEELDNSNREESMFLKWTPPFSLDDDDYNPQPQEKKEIKKILPKLWESEIKKKRQIQFYQVRDVFLREFGSDVAVLIAIFSAKHYFYYRKGKTDFNGFFYFKHPEIEESTGITIYRQKKAMEILVNLEILFISDKKKGIPPKKFYRVDHEQYEKVGQYFTEKFRKR